MRSFARRRARVIVTAVAVWLSVSRASASAQTAKERFEAAQQRDEKVRVLLTNFTDATPPPDLVAQVSQVMTSFEVDRAPLPRQRLRRQRAVAGGQPRRCGVSAASIAPRIAIARCSLYRWLVQEYPTSSFVKQANAQDGVAHARRRLAAPTARRRRRSPPCRADAAVRRRAIAAAPTSVARRSRDADRDSARRAARQRSASRSSSIAKWRIAKSGWRVRRACSST